MRVRRKGARRQGRFMCAAEELERRVLLSAAIAAFAPQVTFAPGSQPRSVSTADVNGDGTQDLLIANSGTNSIAVALGNGNGTFGPQTTFAVGATPFSVIAADVNGDGKPDLIVANYGAGTVSILLGNGNGTFAAPQTFGAGAQDESVA